MNLTRLRSYNICGGEIQKQPLPSLLSNKLKHEGVQMITALNLLKVDLATFGNHEFDRGCRILAERVSESIFPWEAANVDLPREANLPGDKVRPYRILKVARIRVGIFGLTLPLAPASGCDPIPITFREPIEAALAPYAKEIAPFDRVIGEGAVALDLRKETLRERESNFGNYVADVLRSAMEADAALINGGAFRDDRVLKPGPIRLRDLCTALPFDNQMVLIKITGRQLVEALENGSVSQAGGRAGFPRSLGSHSPSTLDNRAKRESSR